MAMDPSVPVAWWLCPNEPRCPHGAVLHDIEVWDDESPTCTVDDCACGHPDLAVRLRRQLADLDPDHQWDIAAGYPHGNPEHGYVIRCAREGDPPQPFYTITLPEPPASQAVLDHYAEVAAKSFLAFSEQFDAHPERW